MGKDREQNSTTAGWESIPEHCQMMKPKSVDWKRRSNADSCVNSGEFGVGAWDENKSDCKSSGAKNTKVNKGIRRKTTKPDVEKEPSLPANKLDIIQKALIETATTDLSITRPSNYLLVSRVLPYVCDVSKGGPCHAARVIILDNGKATFQVFHKTRWTTCLLDKEGNIIEEELQALLDCFDGEFRMCHGIGAEGYSELSKHIHINIKNKTEQRFPYHRVVSTTCLEWFKVGKTTNNRDRCHNCKELVRYVRKISLRTKKTPEEKLNNCLEPTSNFKFTKLTPRSQQIRIKKKLLEKVLNCIRKSKAYKKRSSRWIYF